LETKAYIESGILESYVLHITSEQERQEVECMSKIYPEIRTELTELELSMEQYAHAFATPPPDALREKVLAAMQQVTQENASPKEAVPVTTVVPMTPYKLRFQLAAAATILLLLGSFFYYQQTTSQLEETNGKLTQLEQNTAVLKETGEASEAARALLLADMKILKDTANRSIKMAGVGTHTDALATVYWDGKQTYLDVQQLPVPSEEKQYQLWAIVEGVPVDAGTFEVIAGSMVLQKMKPIENAQAFAVTLETKGGNPVPTLEAMYVVGNVGS